MNKLRAAAITLIIIIVIGYAMTGFQPGRAAGSYDYYREITLESDEVPSTLTNFPIVIQATIADLATTANGGDIENTVATGGASSQMTVPADFDIGSDSDCSTGLNFEFEEYNATTGEVIVWVNIPSLDGSTDTTIYMCYGDSGTTTSQENVNGTWNSNYIIVHHMDNTDNANVIYDSQSGGHDAARNATYGNNPGQIGEGLSFDGSEDYWAITDHADLDITGDLTITAWVRLAGLTGDIKVVLSKGGPNGYDMLALPAWDLDTNMYFDSDDLRSNDSINDHSWSVNTWHHLAVSYSDSNNRYEWYHDGVSDGSQSTSATLGTTATDIHIGSQPANTDRNWYGRLDEIRIADVERSDDWVEMEYTSATSATFVTIGSEQEPTPTETPTETPSNTPTATATSTPAVILGDSSIPVDEGLEAAIATAVNEHRPDGLTTTPHADMFVISSYNESDTDYYYWVSVNGIDTTGTPTPDYWDLHSDGVVWQGNAIAHENPTGTFEAYIEGSDDYETMLDAAALDDIASPDQGGTGSYYYTFPWASGYTAFYGTLGVHGSNDDAVDWVGGTTRYADSIFPNGVYVSQGGYVSNVCRDDVQTWVTIGQFRYGHLVDNSTLREGVYHSQGSYLGALVTGTHLTPKTAWKGCPVSNPDCVDSLCGYMQQYETSYHLHWVLNTNEQYFRVEDWVLNLNTGIWTNGDQTRSPGQYMLAEWGTRPLVPTPPPTVTPGGPTVTPGAYTIPIYQDRGGQIWDGLISFAEDQAYRNIEDITDTYSPMVDEDSAERELVPLALSGARIAIRSIYVILRSNLNLTITMLVLTIIFIAEPIRALRAIWMAIKEMIPFLG